MSQTAEVIKAEENQIVEFNEFETKLTEFKERYDNVVYDLDDPAQDKQARSDRLSIGKVVSTLDKTHKELKAPLKAKTDLIDAERKRIKDDLLGIQDKIKGQIAEHERKAQEHAEMLQQKVEDIESFGIFPEFHNPVSGEISARLDSIEAINVDDSYEHRKADATLAQIDTIKKLKTMFDSALKSEAEQAELERLRKQQAEREQADRDKKIAEEAVKIAEENAAKKLERIRLEAKERAEKQQKALEDEADRKVREAEERGRRAVEEERERIFQEKKKAEDERAAAELKAANKKHRAKINNEALKSLIENGYTEDQGKALIELIATGLIVNITINY